MKIYIINNIVTIPQDVTESSFDVISNAESIKTTFIQGNKTRPPLTYDEKIVSVEMKPMSKVTDRGDVNDVNGTTPATTPATMPATPAILVEGKVKPKTPRFVACGVNCKVKSKRPTEFNERADVADARLKTLVLRQIRYRVFIGLLLMFMALVCLVVSISDPSNIPTDVPTTSTITSMKTTIAVISFAGMALFLFAILWIM